MLIEKLVFIIFFLILLIFGVKILINSLLKIAHYLKLSDFIIAFLIGGISTSLPELILGIQSSIFKVNQISLGNVLGANINDLSFILGISILIPFLFKRLNFNLEYNLGSLHFVLIFLITIAPYLLAIDGYLSFVDGIFLFLLFFGYSYFAIKENKIKIEKLEQVSFKEFFNSIFYSLFSIILIVVSSFFVIKESKNLVNLYGLNNIPFGALILSISSTMPELLFSYQSMKKNLVDFAIGNIFGSVAFNSNIVLAVNAILNPFKIEERINLFINLIFLVFIFLIDWHFLKNKQINILFSIFLLAYWLLFLVVNFIFLV
jgi:cation:H+ antiporter